MECVFEHGVALLHFVGADIRRAGIGPLFVAIVISFHSGFRLYAHAAVPIADRDSDHACAIHPASGFRGGVRAVVL